jgi:hypothetical protein
MLLTLLGCIIVQNPPDETCEDTQAAFATESARIRSCTDDDECGQVLEQTSCGCTHDLVARTDADTTEFYALIEAAAGECDLGLISDCDCPAAYGFECDAGTCAWDYADGTWLPDCRADHGDAYQVDGVAIAGDTLTVTLATGGGCETHDWVLCWPDGAFAESNPVQAHLDVWHDAHDDPCDAWLTEDVPFDLTPLRNAWLESYGSGPGSMIIVVGGESVSYSF